MREITQDSLNKLTVKKTTFTKAVGQDITYVCTVCGNVEKEYALTSRHTKVCGRCSHPSVKSNLLETLNWVESDIQPPDYNGD